MRLDEVALSPHFKEHAAWIDPAFARAFAEAASRLPAVPAELAVVVEDEAATMAERLAAGHLLGLLGDPRITPMPRVCRVDGCTTPIGLRPQDMAGVVSRWAHVGVEQSWIEKEVPEHAVELARYWICTYPVTNAEYYRFLRETGRADRPTTWYLGAYPYQLSNHPVAGIQPSAADAYAVWFSEQTGHPWRLPTEAEWEYAAKGPMGLEFPWGAQFDVRCANTRETGIHTTTPVGAFPAGQSPLGALDMGGNVEEFVADDYRPYPGGPFVADHLVETMGAYRVARGGSFCRFGDLTRTRRRHGAFPGVLYPVGLRLATSVEPAQE